MASEAKQKQKEDQKARDEKRASHTESKPKAEAKPPKEKEKKAKAAAAAPDADTPKPAPPPRMPSDPRVKLMKQFRAKLLPRGDLRDRYRALLQRWEASDDHGGVTVQELQSLMADRRSERDSRTRVRRA